MRKKTIIALFIVILYFIPLFIQFDFTDEFHMKSVQMGLPKISSGDIPHYLVVVSSIVKDLDLELSNNYNDALHKGTCDLGKDYIKRPIDRHTMFVNKNTNERHVAAEFVDTKGEKLIRAKDVKLEEYYEYPTHAFGMSLLVAPFLMSFNSDNCNLEHASVFLTTLVSLIGLFFLYLTICTYTSKNVALEITAIFALATPLWHYAGTFWTEPYVATTFIAAYYFFVMKQQNFIPAILIGAASLIKHPAASVIPAFILYRMIRKEYSGAIKFSFSILVPLIIFAAYHVLLFGSPFETPKPFHFGDPIFGMFGLLFSKINGLLVFTPMFIFSFLGFKKLYKENKEECIFLFLLIFFYWFTWANFQSWWGDGYSARYIIPSVPLLAIPFTKFYISQMSEKTKIFFYCILTISFVISIQAAFLKPIFWNNPPWILLDILINKFDRLIQILI